MNCHRVEGDIVVRPGVYQQDEEPTVLQSVAAMAVVGIGAWALIWKITRRKK